MKKFRTLFTLALCLTLLLSLSSCADVQHGITPYLQGQTSGFWAGLWHGMISPFSFIASLFMDDVAIYAVNNNGGFYNFGFIIGIGTLSGGSTKASR